MQESEKSFMKKHNLGSHRLELILLFFLFIPVVLILFNGALVLFTISLMLLFSSPPLFGVVWCSIALMFLVFANRKQLFGKLE